jgi:RHS repeat-associated protein
VASITDLQMGATNRTMGYDDLDRLTSVSAPNLWGNATYTHDSLDNLRTSTITAGATARTLTMGYPDPSTNRLMSTSGGPAAFNFSYNYDVQGNIIQRGGQAYVFDQGNRMTSAPGKATYGYDGLGHRISVIGTDGVNRVQVYSQGGQLMYAGPTGSTGTKYIYMHNHVLAEAGPGGVQYDHTDGLGSPVARTDASAALLSRTRYEPYGYTAAGTVPGIGFTGHVNDADTSLVYMQQRYYDPVAGRFLSIDPVTTDANTGGSFNRYAYANNSPYKYIDPDGRLAFLIPLIPYVATATVAVVGHYVLPGRQGREDTARAVGNAILNQGNNAPGTVGSDKGCIYLCDGVSPGQKTPSGRPYVGSADDLEKRARGARDGRERENAKPIGEYDKGGKDGRANSEQNGMNEHGGKGELDNKRNEVDQKKWGDRGIKPPEEKKSE